MANPAMNRPASIIPRLCAPACKAPPRINHKAPMKTIVVVIVNVLASCVLSDEMDLTH